MGFALKPFTILLFALLASTAFGQTPEAAPPVPEATQQLPSDESGVPNTLTSLTGQFFEHNFFNLDAFVDGLHDSEVLGLNTGGRTGSWGVRAGGGVDLFHQWNNSLISLDYQGSYTDYQGGGYLSGTNQRFSVVYSKRLGRRWTVSARAQGGMFLYGFSSFYPVEGVGGVLVNNPFSPENKFLSTGLALSYQQTRRLSYEVAGNFFLSRFTSAVGFASNGGSGSASVNYQLNARNILSGSYSHTYVAYLRNAGNAQMDGYYMTLKHYFSRSWTALASAGVTRTDTSAHVVLPVQFIFNGQLVTAYTLVPYNRTSYIPTFQVSATHQLRRSALTLSAGQDVVPGNGIYLTSRALLASGFYSRTMRRANFSAGATYSHLTSVSANIARSYASGDFSASYGYNLVRYISANLRYDYLSYGSFSGLSGIRDNRITIGITFSTKSVPMTLF